MYGVYAWTETSIERGFTLALVPRQPNSASWFCRVDGCYGGVEPAFGTGLDLKLACRVSF